MGHQQERAGGKSIGHVTDDVTGPRKIKSCHVCGPLSRQWLEIGDWLSRV